MRIYFCLVETEAWFIDSFEEWRKAKNLSNFILLGHSFGGYVAAKYALKVIWSEFCYQHLNHCARAKTTEILMPFLLLQHPEHVQHLVLVGPAGFSDERDPKSEWLIRFRATWKGAIMKHLWESNFTPMKLVRLICFSLIVLFYYLIKVSLCICSGFLLHLIDNKLAYSSAFLVASL